MAGVARVGEGDGKASIERLCLSLYVETFNSKVIKGFVPEQRSRYVFLVFRDSYVLYLYGYEHHMSISQTWVSISNGLFRRWKEREKTQGPQRNKKKKPKTRKTKCGTPRKKERKKRRKTTVETRPPEKKKEKEEKQLISKRRKKGMKKRKRKRRRAANEKKRWQPAKSIKKGMKKEKEERRYLLIV